MARVDREAKEACKNYTTEQLLKIQRECGTIEGKARVQRELQRRRDAARRAERGLAPRATPAARGK